MNEKADNLYIPDYRAWESFYEKRAKRDQRVGLQTESETLNQQQQIIVNPERAQVCEQSQPGPKIVSVVSPTEQTVQQAANVMKKASKKGKSKRSSKKGSKGRGSCSKGRRSKNGERRLNNRGKRSSFSYRTLGDIFSKRK
ncbi:MAG: hypothetical protein AB2693_27360 [Candidatus Thiodiazotropha sp.]